MDEGKDKKPRKTEGGEQTFSESYVVELRKENAKYRTRAKEAEKENRRLKDKIGGIAGAFRMLNSVFEVGIEDLLNTEERGCR